MAIGVAHKRVVGAARMVPAITHWTALLESALLPAQTAAGTADSCSVGPCAVTGSPCRRTACLAWVWKPAGDSLRRLASPPAAAAPGASEAGDAAERVRLQRVWQKCQLQY